MLALGIRLRAPFGNRSGLSAIDLVCEFRTPSNAAMCQFQHTLDRVENRYGAVTALFESMRLKLLQQLAHLAVRIGYDVKKIKSHSTIRKLAHRLDPETGEHLTSDPDAGWGRYDHYSVDGNGKEKVTAKILLGQCNQCHS